MYVVVSEGSIIRLMQAVNSNIKSGWICQGGIIFTGTSDGYCQAMIKKEV